MEYLLGAVDAGADWHADVDAAFAGDASGVAHADATEAAGHALEAAARGLAVRLGRRLAAEALDPAAAPRRRGRGPAHGVRQARRDGRRHVPAADRSRRRLRRHQHGQDGDDSGEPASHSIGGYCY
jgi:hypothetical protein